MKVEIEAAKLENQHLQQLSQVRDEKKIVKVILVTD